MAVRSHALTTLTNAKTQLGVSGSGDDTKLEQLIDRASTWIETQTNRKLKARKYNGASGSHSTTGITSEDYLYFDGATLDEGGETVTDNGYGVYHLPQYPVEADSVVAFKLGVLTARDVTGDTWDDTELLLNQDFLVDRTKGVIRLLGGRFAHGFKNYRITMSAGYAYGGAQPYVPEDLEELCIKLVELVYKNKANLQSESLGTWSRTFNTSKEDPFVADTLQKYSRLSI